MSSYSFGHTEGQSIPGGRNAVSKDIEGKKHTAHWRRFEVLDHDAPN